MTLRYLGLAGSLREASLNKAALEAAARLAPDGIVMIVDHVLRTLPLYDYDLDTDRVPVPVANFRQAVAASHALIIATPEYAHGIAGPMKNALDWLVGDRDFPGKPVAVWNMSPRATHAQAHLREVLTTMSARIVEQASISLPLLGRDWSATTIAASSDFAGRISAALLALSAV